LGAQEQIPRHFAAEPFFPLLAPALKATLIAPRSLTENSVDKAKERLLFSGRLAL
jgi:hypothetical protein